MHVPGKQTEKIQPFLSQQKIVRIPGLENQYKTQIFHILNILFLSYTFHCNIKILEHVHVSSI